MPGGAAAFARESAAGPVGTGMLLGMLGFALYWLADVPFDRTRALVGPPSRRQPRELRARSASAGGSRSASPFVILCVALAIVMGLARLVGRWWWALAAPAFVGLAAFFAFVSPYLDQGVHPIDDPALQATVAQLEREAHVGHVPVKVQHVHTSLPNAETEGLGPSRRVVIWDSLLDGRFTPGEVRVVIAHELGHVKRNHIWKSVAWYALFAFPGTFLIGWAVGVEAGWASRRRCRSRCSCSWCSSSSQRRSRT